MRTGFQRGMARLLLLMTALAMVDVAGAGSDDLTRFFTSVKSYSARFEQTVIGPDRRGDQRSTGSLWIQRPDRFRWEYDAPYEQQIVGDGNKVWVYDVGLEQVTVRAMAQALGDTPAALLAGTGDLNRDFSVHALARKGSGDTEWIGLRPKNKDSGFEEIRLAFARERLAAIELVDGFGQTTRIVLRDYQENVKIDPGKFRFVPPPGVDVLEQ